MAALLIIGVLAGVFDWALIAATHCPDEDEDDEKEYSGLLEDDE